MLFHKLHGAEAATSPFTAQPHHAEPALSPALSSAHAPTQSAPSLHPTAEKAAPLFSHFAEAAAPKVNVADPSGILSHVHPTGASALTARQEGLRKGGVNASETIAERDWHRVLESHDLRHKFEVAGQKYHIPPALLAAIASRETHGGSLLDRHGEGDHGHGYGILQVDDRSHRPDRSGGAYGQAHINQAAGIFDAKLEAVKKQFPHLSPEAQLETAVSRYNGGSGRPHPNSDRGTTHADYANDTLARAQYYSGHWTKP